VVRRKSYFDCGGYNNVLLEDVDFSRRIDKLGEVRFIPCIKVINSSRRLEVMGLLGILYYYILTFRVSWVTKFEIVEKSIQ